jgi:hypothetical protein
MYKLLTKGELITYSPEIVGDFPDKIFPVEEKLQLKVGAQVMFETIYHSKKTISMVKWALLNRSLVKKFSHFPEENKTIEVDKYEWQNILVQSRCFY